MTNSEPQAPTDPRIERRRRVVLGISRAWAWVFLLGLIIFFTISVFARTDGEVFFHNLRNIQSILNTIVPVLLLGLGQTFVIISGGIELSVGWVMGLSSVVSARSRLLLVDAGVAVYPAIFAGLHALLKLPSFFAALQGRPSGRLGALGWLLTWTTMSSAKRVYRTFSYLPCFVDVWACSSIRSTSLRNTFAHKGPITEPWGSPRFPPAFRMSLQSRKTSSSCMRRASLDRSKSCRTVSK